MTLSQAGSLPRISSPNASGRAPDHRKLLADRSGFQLGRRRGLLGSLFEAQGGQMVGKRNSTNVELSEEFAVSDRT